MGEPKTILVAGIGGASLGTEIGKSLRLSGKYRSIGADISAFAYGHYDKIFTDTFLVERDGYVDNLLDICLANDVSCIIPGAEQPTALLAQARARFESAGIKLAMNSSHLVGLLSDKDVCFQTLSSFGVQVPHTRMISKHSDLDDFPMPCIIKPSVGSGGSSGVHFAPTIKDAWQVAQGLLEDKRAPVAQRYISHGDGEFTAGVLSLPNGKIVGSVALRRVFDNKLSVSASGANYLISSGYSQGLIDDFPQVRKTAEMIARKIGSVGPINLQGRMLDGEFVPFEINPRFSATTYLRALAGFNEVVMYLDFILHGQTPEVPKVKPGWYLRSFKEVVIDKKALRS